VNRELVAAERRRIIEEYDRRRREISADRYAPWNPSVLFMRTTRVRVAAAMLARRRVFPKSDDACLEIGVGLGGWLPDLITWGVHERALHGIDVDPQRIELAQALLPTADLRVGDGAELPWENDSFRLIVVSTVMSSVLDSRVRKLMADEITRCLAPGAALLWYDFVVNNPQNDAVRGINRREVRELFPTLSSTFRSVTLAPPILRCVAGISWYLATALEALSPLRTHLLGVLVKPTID